MAARATLDRIESDNSISNSFTNFSQIGMTVLVQCVFMLR